jgi:pilus assembly protein CpaE
VDPTGSVSRILVVHPEGATRQAIEEALRDIGSASATTYHASSPAEALDGVRRIDPRFILLDLSHQRELGLEVARQLQRPHRHIIGLYDPLLLQQESESEFFRLASRSGIDDFVPLPAASAELEAALAAAPEVTDSALEGRAVSFMGAKGGVGTTTLAVHTALALADAKLKSGDVALVDAVTQLGTAASLLGVAPDRDLVDLVRDLDDLKAPTTYLTQVPHTELHFLASPFSAKDAERVTPQDMSRALIGLRRRFGCLVIDAPSHLDLLTLAALDLSDVIFVVTEASTPSVLSTARLLALLAELGFAEERVRVVANRYESPETSLTEAMIADQIGRRVDLVVAEDRAVKIAAIHGAPVAEGRKKPPFIDAVDRLAGLVRDALGSATSYTALSR